MFSCEGLAEIAAEDGALWLECGGDLQVFASGPTPGINDVEEMAVFALADLYEAASEPGISQCAIDVDGAIEVGEGAVVIVPCGKEVPFEGEAFGVAGRQFQAFVQRVAGLADTAETEFE